MKHEDNIAARTQKAKLTRKIAAGEVLAACTGSLNGWLSPVNHTMCDGSTGRHGWVPTTCAFSTRNGGPMRMLRAITSPNKICLKIGGILARHHCRTGIDRLLANPEAPIGSKQDRR